MLLSLFLINYSCIMIKQPKVLLLFLSCLSPYFKLIFLLVFFSTLSNHTDDAFSIFHIKYKSLLFFKLSQFEVIHSIYHLSLSIVLSSLYLSMYLTVCLNTFSAYKPLCLSPFLHTCCLFSYLPSNLSTPFSLPTNFFFYLLLCLHNSLYFCLSFDLSLALCVCVCVIVLIITWAVFCICHDEWTKSIFIVMRHKIVLFI